MNPAAKAGSSSAAGLFQFVEQTWLSTLKQHGSKHGYARYADLISKGSDGRYRVPAATRRARAVMDLRLDPHASSLMAGELTSDHAAYLRGPHGTRPDGRRALRRPLPGAAGLGEADRGGAEPARRRRPPRCFPTPPAPTSRSSTATAGPSTVAEVYANLTRTGGAGQAPGRARAPGRRLHPVRLGPQRSTGSTSRTPWWR